MIQKEFDHNITSFLPHFSNSDRFLLAVSGGIDSMCMANLFYSSPLKLTFGIANVNFKLREEEGRGDQLMVKHWAEERGIPFYEIEFNTSEYAQEHSISTQMAARELRYNWFNLLMEEHHYDHLAIAHNISDSAETLFLNLLRGTGMKGLAGIRRTNGKIVRPLITITREDIAKYVADNNVPYREDRTNRESHYHRNRLRNVVFPEFKKINPSFIHTVTRSTAYFTQAEELLNDLYRQKEGVLYTTSTDLNGGVSVIVNIPSLMEDKHKDYWLYRILSEYGFNSSQIDSVSEALLGQSGKVFTSSTHELIIDRGEIKIYPIMDDTHAEFMINSSGVYNYKGMKFKIDFFVKNRDFNPYTTPDHLYFAADHLKFPLICRGWLSADKFKPLGMKGFKKLSDFFKDLKMDKRGKESQPIIISGDDIVCLPGLRIDERYKIKTSTKLIVEVILVE